MANWSFFAVLLKGFSGAKNHKDRDCPLCDLASRYALICTSTQHTCVIFPGLPEEDFVRLLFSRTKSIRLYYRTG